MDLALSEEQQQLTAAFAGLFGRSSFPDQVRGGRAGGVRRRAVAGPHRDRRAQHGRPRAARWLGRVHARPRTGGRAGRSLARSSSGDRMPGGGATPVPCRSCRRCGSRDAGRGDRRHPAGFLVPPSGPGGRRCPGAGGSRLRRIGRARRGSVVAGADARREAPRRRQPGIGSPGRHRPCRRRRTRHRRGGDRRLRRRRWTSGSCSRQRRWSAWVLPRTRTCAAMPRSAGPSAV